MVKSYLRHGPTEAFGLICSAGSNSVYDGRLAFVPALEDVLVWDVKKSQQMAMWHETGHRAEVTAIIQSPQPDRFVVGYADGSVRLWNATTGTVLTTFNGHTKAVTALAFDETGTRLASGSQDTTVIIWDVLGEVGLFRLRGHRDQITAIRFIRIASNDAPSTSYTVNSSGYLLTSSKDTFLKLWDLSTQHCIQTVVAHRGEVWALDINPARDVILTGSAEGELKAWRLNRESLEEGLKENENGEPTQMIHPLSSLSLSSHHRVHQIAFHPTEPFLGIQSHDRSVEIFRIRTDEEIHKKQLRKKKRAKEKGKDNKDQDMNTTAPEDDTTSTTPEISDRYTPYLIIRGSGKIKSFDFASMEVGRKGGVHILLALSTNALEVFQIPQYTRSKEATPEATRAFSVDLPGHRTDVRSLCLSSDDGLLASASNGSLKIWNLKTTSCIRTMESSYAICSTFLPGDKYVAVGTKTGEILVYDIAASSLVDTVKAHSNTLWSMQVRPDEQALVTGSADKDVKFWELKQQTTENGQKILKLTHVRTLKLTDEVLSVRYSPNGKLLAVSLLDSTVKIFYQDSLKFFLSLYGHKLPVLAMDISMDSKLIVTCSADKNVKIWGLDFGDCHKSIFAHEDSIMQVAFEREKNSHYFWTVSKDKMVKYWDGDKFENIQKLDGHHGEIWALAISNFGKFVVTGSHDKSIRVYEKLDEPLFLEEERERELEQLYEENIAESMNQMDLNGKATAEEGDATAVSKQTSETLMAGEHVMEAIDLADAELAKSPDAPRNPLLITLAETPEEHVLHVMEKISSTALHDALLVLPFTRVISLIKYLGTWTKKGWNIALTSRILFFVLRIHYNQIVTNRVLRDILIPLRTDLRNALREQEEVLSYNLAALQFMNRKLDAERTAQMFEEAELDEEKVREKIQEATKKRKRVKV